MRPPAEALHGRRHALGGEPDGLEIRVHDVVPVALDERPEGCVPERSRIVDEDAHRAERPHDVVDEPADVVAAGDVGLERKGLAARAGDGLHRRLGAGRVFTVVDRDARARAPQLARDLDAGARGRARDERDLPGEDLLLRDHRRLNAFSHRV
jgi:hypothetical protein